MVDLEWDTDFIFKADRLLAFFSGSRQFHFLNMMCSVFALFIATALLVFFNPNLYDFFVNKRERCFLLLGLSEQ